MLQVRVRLPGQLYQLFALFMRVFEITRLTRSKRSTKKWREYAVRLGATCGRRVLLLGIKGVEGGVGVGQAGRIKEG